VHDLGIDPDQQEARVLSAGADNNRDAGNQLCHALLTLLVGQ